MFVKGYTYRKVKISPAVKDSVISVAVGSVGSFQPNRGKVCSPDAQENT